MTRGWIGYNVFNGQYCLLFPVPARAEPKPNQVPGARAEPEPNQDTFHLPMNKFYKKIDAFSLIYHWV